MTEDKEAIAEWLANLQKLDWEWASTRQDCTIQAESILQTLTSLGYYKAVEQKLPDKE